FVADCHGWDCHHSHVASGRDCLRCDSNHTRVASLADSPRWNRTRATPPAWDAPISDRIPLRVLRSLRSRPAERPSSAAAGARYAERVESAHAPAVCCSAWFGVLAPHPLELSDLLGAE